MAASPFIQACSLDSGRKSYEKGERLLADGDYQGAVAGYSSAASEHPSSEWAPRSLYRIVFIFTHHLDDVHGAMDAYGRLQVLYPGSEEALLARGDMAEAWSRKGEHRKAIEEYQRLIKARPSIGQTIRYKVALEYVMAGDLAQARVELKGLLDALENPGMAPVIMHEIANTYYIEGRMDEAVRRYNEIIEKYPSHPVALEARFGMAKALDEAGRPDDALKVLSGLLSDYPDKEVIKTRIRWIRKRQGDVPPESSWKR